jgi:RND superfamily putative drug exporter
MQRIALLAHRRRWLITVVWLAALVGAITYTAVVGDALTTRQELPGSESIRAGEKLARDFGIARSEPIQVVFLARDGVIRHRSDIEALVARLRALYPGKPIDSPFSSRTGASAVARDGVLAYANIPFDDNVASTTAVPVVQRVVAAGLPGGVRVFAAGGPAIQAETEKPLNEDLLKAESIAAALSLIVLVAVLGTVFAGLVPLILALFVIPIVLSLVFALSHVTDVTIYATNVVTLIGLGIAIDYSLLVVYRFREELNTGKSLDDALVATMRTAVRAVIFSGVTVGIGLGVLLFIRVPFVQSFGLAGILIPIVTIAASLTLLPAILAILGTRINRWRVVPQRILDQPESRFWRRVANAIMRSPALFLAIGLVVIGLVAYPAKDLLLGASPLASVPNVGPGVTGTKLLETHFGNGGSTPVRVVVNAPASALTSVPATLGKRPGIVGVQLTPSPRSADVTLVSVLGEGAVGSTEANALVARLRSHDLPATLPPGTVFLVGGGPAVFADFQDALYGDSWWIAIVVVLATYLVLFRAFRSVILPLKAVVMNVLSVAGAYGLLVLFFQHDAGGLSPFVHVDVIAVWIPLFLFAFLYGLSMDYEVFLLSRMREEVDHGVENHEAVATGLAKTGKLITSAATIMVIAFGGLAASRFVEMQEFGFGLAAAILLDATVIRALIVPSLMQLMGRWNWWLPAWAERFAGRGLQH